MSVVWQVHATGSAPELLSISGVVSIEDVNATLDIPEYDPGSSLIPTSYTLVFAASAVLGGDGGFRVDMSGTIEQDETEGLSAVLHASHEGGWSPLSGSLAEWFYTPMFEGNVALKKNGSYFRGDFYVGYSDSLVLIDGLVEFVPYEPQTNSSGEMAACHRSNATGPYLCVEVVQADAPCSPPPPAAPPGMDWVAPAPPPPGAPGARGGPCDDSWRYVVDFAAGLKLGDWLGSPPVLWAKGKLDSYGISTLSAMTEEAWNLLPDTAFADVVIPALPGDVTFNTSTANATNSSTIHVRSLPAAARCRARAVWRCARAPQRG